MYVACAPGHIVLAASAYANNSNYIIIFLFTFSLSLSLSLSLLRACSPFSLSLSFYFDQLLLYKESNLIFAENNALRKGGGIYIEYVTTEIVVTVLNRACFIQYYSSSDNPPNTWVNIFNVCLCHKTIVTVLFIFRILGLVS